MLNAGQAHYTKLEFNVAICVIANIFKVPPGRPYVDVDAAARTWLTGHLDKKPSRAPAVDILDVLLEHRAKWWPSEIDWEWPV